MKNRLGMKRRDEKEDTGAKDRERKASSSIPKCAEGKRNYSTVRREKITQAGPEMAQSKPALIPLHSLTVTDPAREK